MYLGSLSVICEAKKSKSTFGDKVYRVATFPVVAGAGLAGAAAGAIGGAVIGAGVGGVAGGSLGSGMAAGVLYGNIDQRSSSTSKKFTVGDKLKKKFKNW